MCAWVRVWVGGCVVGVGVDGCVRVSVAPASSSPSQNIGSIAVHSLLGFGKYADGSSQSSFGVQGEQYYFELRG